MFKQLNLFSSFNLNTFNKKSSQNQTENHQTENQWMEYAWNIKNKKDWKEIVAFVQSYISKKIWDTRLNIEDVTQECLLYILENCNKSYVTKSYLKYFILNFINRKLLNGSFLKCVKTIFHSENYIPFEEIQIHKRIRKEGEGGTETWT